MREYITPYNNILGSPNDIALQYDSYPNNLLILFATYIGIDIPVSCQESETRLHNYFHVLYYCKSGHGVLRQNKKEYKIGPGDLFIHYRGEQAELIADETNPWKLVFIGIQGPGGERLNKLKPVYQYKADTFSRIESAFQQGIRSQELYLSFAYEIFYHLFLGKPEPIDLAKWIDNYIHLEYPNAISVEDIAEKLHRNRCYLSQLYKNRYGVSIKEAIIRVRMGKAVEYLREGYSVTETGKMVGYPDAFSFSRMFRKVMGFPPSQLDK